MKALTKMFNLSLLVQCVAREMEVQAEEEQAFLARQQAALSGLKDPTRSPTTRNQASSGPIIQVIPFISGACSLHVACRIKKLQYSLQFLCRNYRIARVSH